ncbi:AMP-binding protein [Streptomyces chartreusis]|uniref:AMP-binding protein n=1 Tax=Streptomyces chartreusis TaxID=1969 RepID=UPI0038631879
MVASGATGSGQHDDQVRLSGFSLLDAVAGHARADPERTAVLDSGRSLSYAELVASSVSLSSTITDMCGGSPVAVRLRRGASLVTALLAAATTGVPFIVVDPEAPAEHTRTSLAAAGVSTLITEGLVPAELASFGVVTPDLRATAPAAGGSGVSAGYLVRTSGSTGTPKLVAVSGSSLERHARTMSVIYKIQPQDRVLQLANPAFDVVIEEVFPALVAGATVVAAPHPVPAPSELAEFAAHHEVTVLNLPTPYWREWVAELDSGGQPVPGSVRLVVIGSDMGDWNTVHRWSEHTSARLINAYGASETTVTCAVWEYEAQGCRQSGALPTGYPLPGVTAFVLAEDGSDAVAPETGELYIGGWCLADGYLDDAERTGAAFVTHPVEPSIRLYRTGDRARRDADGRITVLGRIDSEVNIRGHRVNPSEVSSALMSLDGVSAAHTVVHRDGGGGNRLTAYAVVTSHQNGRALREQLGHLLPGHLLPGEIVVLDLLPVNANGKVDETSLPPVQELLSPPNDTQNSSILTTVDGLAGHVARLWSAELNRLVGVDDNVFDLGAHSLMLAGVRRRLSADLERDIPSIALFTHTTPQALSRFLHGAEATAESGGPQSAPPNRLRARRMAGGGR